MKTQELIFTGLPESPDTDIQVFVVICNIGNGDKKAVALYTDSAEAERHVKSIRETTGFKAWSLYSEVTYK